MTDTPHFALPFRVATDKPVVNEQDSVEDVLACVEAILRYPVGSRDEDPDFGRPADLEFSKGDLDLDALAAQLTEFEPRADTLPAEDRDAFDAALRRVSVGVSASD